MNIFLKIGLLLLYYYCRNIKGTIMISLKLYQEIMEDKFGYGTGSIFFRNGYRLSQSRRNSILKGIKHTTLSLGGPLHQRKESHGDRLER